MVGIDGSDWAEVVEVEESVQWSVAKHALKVLIGMAFIDREIVFRRISGDSYIDIARHLQLITTRKFTRQAVHKRLSTLIKCDSILAGMFESMTTKQNQGD